MPAPLYATGWQLLTPVRFAQAVTFLKRVKEVIEDPVRLLIAV